MGVLNDLLASAKTLDTSASPISGDRSIQRQLEAVRDKIGDQPYPAGFDVTDEVQLIAQHDPSVDDGTFTLTITLADGTTFTTAAIAHDAPAAAIRSAINTAATGVVTGWTNGDIATSGGPLTGNDVTLTFSGDSVAGQNAALTVVTSSLVDPTDAGAVTTPTGGVAPVNEVQEIAAHEVGTDGGTFTLTFLLASTETFTTAAIAHDASAATIETAIDVAATALPVTDWTNGDISVSGGPLTTDPVVLTFDGASVDALNHSQTTIDGASLTGGGAGAASTTTQGVAPVNEVQSIAVYDGVVDGGTFTLTFLLDSTETFTTAAIAFDATAATIETAIDVAATALPVTDWTNGDISASGAPLTTTPLTLTFDGASVDALDHSQTTIDGASLTGGGTAGAASTTTEGVEPVNEVQEIAAHEAGTDGGTFTLTFLLESTETFTTAAIAHDASAATIETAIDVAATALPVGSWTNGDISVSGGPLTTDPVVLTFDGASVDALNHSQTTIDGTSLTGGGPGAESTTTEGVVPVNEVQSLAAHEAGTDGGTFTLTFLLASTETFTTAAIAYNASAAVVETAIDVAATALPVTDWANGHIDAAGGPLTTTAMTFTYSGASVDAQDHSPMTAASSLTEAIEGNEVTVDTEGQTVRTAYAALKVLGIISSAPPVQGEDLVSVTPYATRGNFPHQLSADTIKAIIKEAAVVDGNSTVEDGLLAALGFTG